MAVIKNVERPDYVYVGSETEVLQRMLDHYRATLLWKCEGLDEEELRQQSVKPSELSLFELLRHLTDAERYWFQVCVAGRDLPEELRANVYAVDSRSVARVGEDRERPRSGEPCGSVPHRRRTRCGF